MKTEIQETKLYKDFKKALNITQAMRADDNPFVVECCEIAKQSQQYTIDAMREKLQNFSNNYHVIDGSYIIEKPRLDAFIEELKLENL